METAPLDSQDELTALRALVAEQAAKLESQEAEVIKRDSIIGLLRAQLQLLRHRQHGASSEKIDRKIEQFELMLEEIEASRAEAELRSGKLLCQSWKTHPRGRSARLYPTVSPPRNWSMRLPAIVRPVVARYS